MLDAVLFDLDGTLTDPEEGIVGSFRHAMEVVGHPVAEGVDLRWMIGPAIRDNFTRHGIPDHLHDEAVLAFRARHVEVGLFQAELIVGVTEVLDALRADGIRLGAGHGQAGAAGDHHPGALRDRRPVRGGRGGVADGIPRSKSVIVADALAQLGGPDPVRGWPWWATGATTSTAAGTTAARRWRSPGASPRRASWRRWRRITSCTRPAELLAVLRSLG